jgi:hypothetical protein
LLFKTGHPDRLLRLLALLLLAWFALAQLYLAVARSPSADDAMFLSVPKNWLNGYGWATSYSEKIPVNPDFTGPTALLWLATPLIALFGNKLWIAGLTGLLANLALTAGCLLQLRRYWPRAGLAGFCLVCGLAASQPQDFASLIGYYTGSLLFLLASLLAFDPQRRLVQRAALVGVLTAIALLVKLLLAPAFLLLAVLMAGHSLASSPCSRHQWPLACAALILPAVISLGSWQLFREQQLAGYSDEYRAVHAEYGRQFFLYHGSGIGQWQDAPDKLHYVLRNIDRNLYFVEESLALHGIRNPWLGDAPADEQHWFGWLFLLLVGAATLRALAKAMRAPGSWQYWWHSAMGMTVLAYLGWFLLLAMAMSPGHLFFPMQWVLWWLLLSVALLLATRVSLVQQLSAAAVAWLASTQLLMPVESREQLLQWRHDTLIKADAMLEAATYLQQLPSNLPLAGCGYSGYPRHLEFLLPRSQNFADCLDLIEDHVAQDADGHYHWRAPLTFNLVFSLQTPGINTATGPVLNACKDNVLYRNSEVQVMACRASDLQTLDLDRLMQEIRLHQRWYRTRLRP